jgi:hypothetical protein
MKNDSVRINDNERRVLSFLDAETDHWAENCITFSWIADDTKLGLKEVRRAARSLRRKGLAEFHRGLMTEDGQVAGSGYCISKAGQALLHPCDICGAEAQYEYEGKRECENHHGQSVKQLTL